MNYLLLKTYATFYNRIMRCCFERFHCTPTPGPLRELVAFASFLAQIARLTQPVCKRFLTVAIFTHVFRLSCPARAGTSLNCFAFPDRQGTT